MKRLILLLHLLLPALLAAQVCDYDQLFREGKAFAKQRQYKRALYKFNSARRCDPSKGEIVDDAIEALLDQVEGEKKAADTERERAKQALEDLRKTSGKVVESLLHDAENEVYHLRYAEALEKMNAAADIGQKKPEVARALLEIAFFDAESGRFEAAQAIMTTAAKLLGKETGAIRIDTTDYATTRHAFRQVLKNLNPVRYAEIEARYYPTMIAIKGGEFIMGCEKGENCDTLPRVKLSDFQLARTEATFWQFGLYTAATGRKIQDFSPNWGLDGDNPVVNVNWYQATEYANWLSLQNGLQPAYSIDSLKQDANNTNNDYEVKWTIRLIPNANGYCLPTEAQWEYAARGGTRQDTFLYGVSDDLNAVAWYRENSDTIGVRHTHPVATRLSNGLGLFDMSGNVCEWCWDWFGAYQSGIFENPVGPASGRLRCLRGGSWIDFDYVCRPPLRNLGLPHYRDYIIGFRLARH